MTEENIMAYVNAFNFTSATATSHNPYEIE
jgi:hypothetical protein